MEQGDKSVVRVSEESNVAYGNFRKSSFCAGGECVAVAINDSGTVFIRGSKDKTERTLVFTRKEWTAFVKGVKNSEFDIK